MNDELSEESSDELSDERDHEPGDGFLPSDPSSLNTVVS
jgi:hypothetical protein